MKKTISLLFFACFAMLLVSCHKDGVYNPKKKISRIFETETTHYYYNDWEDSDYNSGRQLREVWTWGKKTLDRIDYYYDNKLSYTQYFSYDKNRLVRMSSDDMYYTYKYDGKFLQQVDVYSDNVLVESFKITHQKGKWSKIEFTLYDDVYMKSGKGDRIMPLRFVLSDEICKSIKESEKKHYAKHGGKGTWSTTYTLTWEKKNVSRMVENDSDGDTYTYTYKYDKKKNPYYGGFIEMEEFVDMLLSENNVIQEDEQSEDGYYSYSYDYTYDGNWPSSRRSSYSRTYEWGSYSSSTLVEYEYQ